MLVTVQVWLVLTASKMKGNTGDLLQGMLLQLELPAEVKPSQSTAHRSSASGNLLLTMPKERPEEALFNVACCRYGGSHHPF